MRRSTASARAPSIRWCRACCSSCSTLRVRPTTGLGALQRAETPLTSLLLHQSTSPRQLLLLRRRPWRRRRRRLRSWTRGRRRRRRRRCRRGRSRGLRSCWRPREGSGAGVGAKCIHAELVCCVRTSQHAGTSVCRKMIRSTPLTTPLLPTSAPHCTLAPTPCCVLLCSASPQLQELVAAPLPAAAEAEITHLRTQLEAIAAAAAASTATACGGGGVRSCCA